MDIDPVNGIIKRRSTGKIAGATCGRYVHVMIDRKIYKAHRLVWFYVHKKWPKNELDHRDGHRHSNGIHNLREATRSQNEMNKPLQKNSTSGFKGVNYHRASEKWQVRIGIGKGKRISLGYFSSPEEAYSAYLAAQPKYHGEFACQ